MAKREIVGIVWWAAVAVAALLGVGVIIGACVGQSRPLEYIISPKK